MIGAAVTQVDVAQSMAIAVLCAALAADQHRTKFARVCFGLLGALWMLTWFSGRFPIWA